MECFIWAREVPRMSMEKGKFEKQAFFLILNYYGKSLALCNSVNSSNINWVSTMCKVGRRKENKDKTIQQKEKL
jgi:hypothetical protein